MTPVELNARVRIDLDGIATAQRLISELRHRPESTPTTVHDLAAIGTYLHNIYNGIENVLLQFLAFHDVPKPRGESSHAELLSHFTRAGSGTANLPHLFDAVSEDYVRQLKGFRHVFRNTYAIDLNPNHLLPQANAVEHWLPVWVEAVEAALAAAVRT